jgi:Transmembrane domain of unknown function (DUF3566)
VTPSKRAGDTVDTVDQDVDQGRSDANGNGHSNGNGNGADGGSRPRRRSVVSPASTPIPERGSSSSRGASSSSITKRSLTGTEGAFPEDGESDELGAAPAATTGDVEPSVAETSNGALGVAAAAATLDAEPDAVVTAPDESTDGVVPIPMPPPTNVVAPLTEADVPRPIGEGARGLVAPIPLPMIVPQGPASLAGPPLERGSGELTRPADPLEQPGSPYVGSASLAVAPVPRLLGRRPRVRRVTRVVRHVDPWSVFKIAIVFNLVLYVVLLTAGVLLWNVADATGTVDNLERFFESFGWTTFEFHGGAIFHAAWIAGLFGVIGLTGVAVLGATLFNLITDLVGGVRLTVLEEEVQERTMAPMRRFVVRRPTAPNAGDPSTGLRRESDRLPEPHVPNNEP